MNIRCSRNTGFYGMGSPIEIRKEHEKWFYLYQDETKYVEVDTLECTIQAKFFLLRSAPVKVVDQGELIELVVLMNPALLLVYPVFFVGICLLSVLHVSVLSVLMLLVLYVIFLFFMLNKAYIIKEKV